MTAGAWLRSQRDRPISDGERRVAFMLIAVAVTAGALLLASTVPAPSPNTALRLPDGARPETLTPALSVVSTATEEHAAHRFLHGYLAYVYGHARAAAVKGATSAFAHSLLASPPRVPPSMRARHPRIVALHIVKASVRGLGVTAIINDGGLVDYPVALLLVRHGHGLLVSGLAGA